MSYKIDVQGKPANSQPIGFSELFRRGICVTIVRLTGSENFADFSGHKFLGF